MIDDEAEAARYRAAVEALPEPSGAVFRFHCVIGLELALVAKGLGIQPADAEAHLAAALVAIDRALDIRPR
jgi:DNA-directed RNA polymerase specialized sigma24 family protein